MQHKSVENYQFEQSKVIVEDGIQAYVAKHTVLNQNFLLKKVNIKEPKERKNYQALINQVGILRNVSHPFIAECHKMLRTPNNIYLVYNYCEGNKLSQLINNKDSLTHENKISISNSLIIVVKKLISCHVVHCNLQPSSIIINQEQNLEVINFLFAHNLEQKQEMSVKFQPPLSDFCAPQIHKLSKVTKKSDLYSLGVILKLLFAQDQSGKIDDDNLQDIIKRLLAQDYKKRPSIQQVEEAFHKSFVKKQKPIKARKISADYLKLDTLEMKSLKKPRSLNQNDESMRKSNDESDNGQENQKQYTLMVLKRRNLALFLLQICEACFSIETSEKNSDIFMGCIFLKLSTRITAGLLGFLKSQKQYENQLSDPILDKSSKKIFEKKPDYFKLVSIITKQSSNQKRWLDEILKFSQAEFSAQQKSLLNGTINDDQIKTLVKNYLETILNTQEIQIQHKFLVQLYFMSEILVHGSYEQLFDELISEQKIHLEEQVLYIQANKMQDDEIIHQISSRINEKQ